MSKQEKDKLKKEEESKVEAALNNMPPIVDDKKEDVVPPVTEGKKEETVPPVKEETVEISRKDFNELMFKLEKLTKDSDLLMKATDKSRLAKAMGEGGDVLIKQAKVSTWDNTGKFIIGWKLITDRCEIVMGRWIEEQTVTLILEDGESITVPLLEFYRKTIKKIPGDIISRTDEFDSEMNKIQIFKIQFANGKTLLINSSFIN